MPGALLCCQTEFAPKVVLFAGNTAVYSTFTSPFQLL